MSIDKALLDQLMEGRSPDDLFGKDGVLSELTKALVERALNTCNGLRLSAVGREIIAISGAD